MTVRSQTREIPPLSLRASFEPATLNREKRTVEVTWSTGARVLRGFWDRFWEELSMDAKHVRLDRLNNGAPYLANHDVYDVASQPGVVERAWLTKADDGTSVGRAVVRFVKAGVDPEADRLFEKIADGITLNTSIGYRVHKFEKVSDAEDGIPVMRAVDWTPNEISSVTVGADDGAGVRSATRSEPNTCEFIIRGEAPHEEKTMSDEKTPAPVVLPTRTNEQIDENAETVRAQLAERQRMSTILTLSEKHGLPKEFSQRLIDSGASLDKARSEILDELAKRSEKTQIDNHQRITGGEDARDKFMRGAEAWLVMRSGQGAIVERAAKAGKVKPAETDPGEFRGFKLIDLARESLERAGVRTRMMSDERIAELALSKRAGMATASDFPVLLENVTNKILLSAYEVTPHEWSRFCGRGSVSNFHEHNRYRKGAFGTLDAVNDHGELKSKSIPDGEKRAVSVGTYGNKIGITRKTLIQDDMGVFTDLASAFGAAAMNTVEAAVWTTVKANSGLGSNYDANPLFHASRSNINTTGSALSAAGLDADAVIMARQAAPSGTTVLNLVPAVLVLPREFRAQANIINNDAFDPDTSTKQGKSNPARGLFRDIVASAQLTGTRRYLFADPAIAPVIEVTFLQGQETPQMESQEGFDVLGLQWRVYLDFGVNLVDYRGAVTNAGQ